MQTINVDEKQRLNITGLKNRQLFLLDYKKDLAKVPTVTSVHESYSSLIDEVLGSSSYIFVTVNLNRTNIKRVLDDKKTKAGGVLPDNFLALGQEYYGALRSGASIVEAMDPLWNKFLKRLNQKVLGSKYKRYGHFIRWIRVYENETKRYCNEPTNHVHLLIEVPTTTNLSTEFNQLKFEHQFRELFSRLVYPIFSPSSSDTVITILKGRLTGSNAHPNYIRKQIINWETASDRVFTSGVPKPKVQ
jgi:hypothetical protein